MVEADRELVAEKIRMLFTVEDANEASTILDDFNDERFQDAKSAVQLAVLRISNGKLELLRSYMKTARGDYRDVLLLAREPNQFRVQMLSGFGSEEEKLALQQDREQYDSWLRGNHIPVCENCAGVGILPFRKADAKSGWDVEWKKCEVCDGKGTMSKRMSWERESE